MVTVTKFIQTHPKRLVATGLTLAASALILSAPVSAQQSTPNFGDDSSTWSNDGECDDPRFTGPGMTSTTLLDSDILSDAADCKAAWDAGTLTLKGSTNTNATLMPTDFGDDASEFANDGECDDKRFTGPGMTNTPLLESDVGHDATDCKAAFDAGHLSWKNTTPASQAPSSIASLSEPDFGDDASMFSEDGECDDPRFTGPGMTNTTLLESDIGHDATDCRAAWQAGNLYLNSDNEHSEQSKGFKGLLETFLPKN